MALMESLKADSDTTVCATRSFLIRTSLKTSTSVATDRWTEREAPSQQCGLEVYAEKMGSGEPGDGGGISTPTMELPGMV